MGTSQVTGRFCSVLLQQLNGETAGQSTFFLFEARNLQLVYILILVVNMGHDCT